MERAIIGRGQALWEVVSAMPEHIPAIASNMREEDKFEIWASHRHTPYEALEGSLKRSELAWTCLIHSVPAFMCGVARIGSLISERGSPWLLGTNLFKDCKSFHRDFIRQSPYYVKKMQELFPRLENYIHAGNKFSIKWLKWCGFECSGESTPINGEDFYLFWRDA